MRRVDRVLGEARMLRIRRAARAQGISSRPVTRSDFAVEAEVAERILHDLMEGSLAALAAEQAGRDPEGPGPEGSGLEGPGLEGSDLAEGGFLGAAVADPSAPPRPVDGRKKDPVDVLDPLVLEPFIDACQAAIDAVVLAVDPLRLVRESMIPKVRSTIFPRPAPGASLDVGRVREAAVEDVAVLAMERALLVVVRRVHLENDMRRQVMPSADPGGVDILDGKVRRPTRDKREAARRNADRLHRRGAFAPGAGQVVGAGPADVAAE